QLETTATALESTLGHWSVAALDYHATPLMKGREQWLLILTHRLTRRRIEGAAALCCCLINYFKASPRALRREHRPIKASVTVRPDACRASNSRHHALPSLRAAAVSSP